MGGKDFDDRIVGYVIDQIKEQHGVDIEGDIELEAELRLKAEATKRQLTGRQSVPVSLKVPNPDGEGRAIPVKIEVAREAFEEAASDLLARTEMLLESVLAKADLEWENIDEVLCVGGSSRMPMVMRMLAELSGKKPLLHDPDECVAKGAAIQAALLMKDESLPEVSVGHVLSHSLGVAVMSNGAPIIDHIVPSLTRLPTMQRREGYTTTIDDQTLVQIRIYEGESRDPGELRQRANWRVQSRHHAHAPQGTAQTGGRVSLRRKRAHHRAGQGFRYRQRKLSDDCHGRAAQRQRSEPGSAVDERSRSVLKSPRRSCAAPPDGLRSGDD